MLRIAIVFMVKANFDIAWKALDGLYMRDAINPILNGGKARGRKTLESIRFDYFKLHHLPAIATIHVYVL